MKKKSISKRLIVVLNLYDATPLEQHKISFRNTQYDITQHNIGWDFSLAKKLIQQYDGYVDGIAIKGIRKRVSAGKVDVIVKSYLSLIKTAKTSPVYLGDRLREIFSCWTLRKLLKEHPEYFMGRKVLFHTGIVSPFLGVIKEAGAQLQFADSLVLAHVPILIKGLPNLERFLNISKSFLNNLSQKRINPYEQLQRGRRTDQLHKWIKNSDVFVTYYSLLKRVTNLASLKGKTLIVDVLTDELRAKLLKAGVNNILELKPQSKSNRIMDESIPVLAAIFDNQRDIDDNELPFEDYVVNLIESLNIKPNKLVEIEKIPRRCAFIIHPLAQKDFWKIPALSPIQNMPSVVRQAVEKGLSRIPVFHYGELSGVVSQSTGQQVTCDLYVIMATPKQLLSMNEETAYRSLVRGINKAEKKGSKLAGLGAYTKVVGDSGVTVNRRTSLPVTTGNSFSTATTLWAAREMVEKLGIINKKKIGNRLDAKVMVIGATGSIGRVCSLLTSMAFNEIVLVATRMDKLLELKEDIVELCPGVSVKITTNANIEISSTDLVVTATSSYHGSIFDITKVKPGAVICDCSRPVNVSAEEAKKRSDVLVIEGGSVILPGKVNIPVDIGLPKPSVYACLAETILLTLEGRYEPFSLSRKLSWKKVKEIYKMGLKHGVKLSAIQGPLGTIYDKDIEKCRKLAQKKLMTWSSKATPVKRRISLKKKKVKTLDSRFRGNDKSPLASDNERNLTQ